MVVEGTGNFDSALFVGGGKTDLVATWNSHISKDTKHNFKKWSKVVFHMDKGSFKWINAEMLQLFTLFFLPPVKGTVEFVGWYKDSDYIKLYAPRTDTITGVSDLYAR